MNKKGFTLIELLVTVAILAILASIAIPMYTGYTRGAARQEATSNLQALSLCLEEYYAQNNRYLPPAANPPQTYNWSVNNSGVVTTDTITGWLPSFQPKKAGGTVNKYSYALTVTAVNAYTITAVAQRSPVAGDPNLTLNQDGVKTGPWPN